MILPAAISAILLQTALYSINVVIFSGSNYLAFNTRKGRAVSRPPLAVHALVQFILASTVWIINIVTTFSALESRTGLVVDITDRLSLTFDNGSQSQSKLAIWVVQNAIFELFILHRTYLLCGKSVAKIAFPTFLVAASFAFGVMATASIPLGVGLSTFIAIALVLIANLTITGETPLSTATYALLESAIVYTIFALLNVIFAFISGDSFETFFIALSPAIAISASTLVALESLGLTIDGRKGTSHSSATSATGYE
ncbi:hypothetical protein ONZ45_g19037 [Pleurotus djamor]|nr:hypothetical protein ONZ45_g19037 [Pleurotus djamor]